MRGLSKPIPKTNYGSKKKKIQEINPIKLCSSRNTRMALLMEEKKKQKKK